MMRHHLHMPSYFLGTFTEYPEIGNSSAPISIDMSSYPPNWYILKVIAGKEAKEFKIIKE